MKAFPWMSAKRRAISGDSAASVCGATIPLRDLRWTGNTLCSNHIWQCWESLHWEGDPFIRDCKDRPVVHVFFPAGSNVRAALQRKSPSACRRWSAGGPGSSKVLRTSSSIRTVYISTLWKINIWNSFVHKAQGTTSKQTCVNSPLCHLKCDVLLHQPVSKPVTSGDDSATFYWSNWQISHRGKHLKYLKATAQLLRVCIQVTSLWYMNSSPYRSSSICKPLCSPPPPQLLYFILHQYRICCSVPAFYISVP